MAHTDASFTYLQVTNLVVAYHVILNIPPIGISTWDDSCTRKWKVVILLVTHVPWLLEATEV